MTNLRISLAGFVQVYFEKQIQCIMLIPQSWSR